MATEAKTIAPGPHLTFQPLSLALVFALAVILFLFVSFLSRLYHAEQSYLAIRWSDRGLADLNASRFDLAAADFRTALRYSRDDSSYQLNLAKALLGLKRTEEAHTYLLNLWDRQPENPIVNLELARIAAGAAKNEEALRYYHNAIYATWPGDELTQRREARLELIEFLLRINDKAQAQSELIALAANIGDRPDQQSRLGALFLQAQAYENALSAFRLSLKSDHHNPADLAGAGRAAFELGRYPVAQRYLQAGLAADPDDAQSAALLRSADLVLQLDPFRSQNYAQRNHIVVEAFAAAGTRIASCSVSGISADTAFRQHQLLDEWNKMKPHINEPHLRQNPDLIEPAMDLVFTIEHYANGYCPTPSDTDAALLLIARLHEGS